MDDVGAAIVAAVFVEGGEDSFAFGDEEKIISGERTAKRVGGF